VRANRLEGLDGERALDALVQQCSRPLPVVNGILHTEVWGRSKGAEEVNSHELRALPAELVCIPVQPCALHAGCSAAALPSHRPLHVGTPVPGASVLLRMTCGARAVLQGIRRPAGMQLLPAAMHAHR
jgi:hypothetical protein